jgi:hypothetical protein
MGIWESLNQRQRLALLHFTRNHDEYVKLVAESPNHDAKEINALLRLYTVYRRIHRHILLLIQATLLGHETVEDPDEKPKIGLKL